MAALIKKKEDNMEDLMHHRCNRHDSWWLHDAQGIPLRRVCGKCRKAKMSRYRPEILRGYSQADVNEEIEPEPEVGRQVTRW